MDCPKCGFENPSGRLDCIRCGVIFAKARATPRNHAGIRSGNPDPVAPAAKRFPLGELLLGVAAGVEPLHILGRAVVLIVLIVWGGKLIFSGIEGNGAGASLLHLVNLPFHEFGHLLFRPFGTFLTSLGGTLGQLLIPLVCFGVLLLKTRDPFGAAVAFWWFGENFLDMAPYINDARAGELPLLGGNTGHSSPYGFHDWEYLLTETGLLRYDQTLASLSHVSGSLLMLSAVVWAGWIVLHQYRNRI